MIPTNNAIVAIASRASLSERATRFRNQASAPVPGVHTGVQPAAAELPQNPPTAFDRPVIRIPCLVEFQRRSRRDVDGSRWNSEGTLSLRLTPDIEGVIAEGAVVRIERAAPLTQQVWFALTNYSAGGGMFPNDPVLVDFDLRAVADPDIGATA